MKGTLRRLAHSVGGTGVSLIGLSLGIESLTSSPLEAYEAAFAVGVILTFVGMGVVFALDGFESDDEETAAVDETAATDEVAA